MTTWNQVTKAAGTTWKKVAGSGFRDQYGFGMYGSALYDDSNTVWTKVIKAT